MEPVKRVENSHFKPSTTWVLNRGGAPCRALPQPKLCRCVGQRPLRPLHRLGTGFGPGSEPGHPAQQAPTASDRYSNGAPGHGPDPPDPVPSGSKLWLRQHAFQRDRSHPAKASTSAAMEVQSRPLRAPRGPVERLANSHFIPSTTWALNRGGAPCRALTRPKLCRCVGQRPLRPLHRLGTGFGPGYEPGHPAQQAPTGSDRSSNGAPGHGPDPPDPVPSGSKLWLRQPALK